MMSKTVLVALLVFVSHAGTEPLSADRSQGVTLRIYQVDDTLARVPELVEGQTPNHDRLIPTLEVVGDGAFGGVPAPIVTVLSARLAIDAAGPYRFRVTSDDGALLFIDNKLTVDNDGRHGMIAAESGELDFEHGDYELLVRHFDHAGGRGLIVEWIPPGAGGWALIPGDLLTTERDPTRVTSPGFKRIVGGGRPGDGMPLDAVHPSWRLDGIRPDRFEPMVGAMCFDHRGRLVVGTFFPLQRDDVSLPDIDSKQPDRLVALRGVTLAENPTADPSQVSIDVVAEGLYEPSGLCRIGEDLYVAHRRAITRLRDLDGDGFFETHEDVGTGWEGWNYHQFTFDLEHIDRDGDGPHPGYLYSALSTAMAPPNWEGMGTNAGPNGPMRGGILEVDLSSNHARVIAGGTRTPNGMGLGPIVDGTPSLFYADNQGTWMPTSQFSEVIAGRFYGHFNRTNVVPNLADRYPDGGHPSVFADRERMPPTLFLPQNEVNNSPTESILIEDGPFAGQMLLGELTAGGLRRLFLERINGHWQGALFRHTQGLEVGVNRLVRGPSGELFVGGIGGGGNWNWRGTRFGLQRLAPTGEDTFEYESIRVMPDGFELRFTREVDPLWLQDVANYTVTQWSYAPTEAYGGAKQRIEELAVVSGEARPVRGGGSAIRLRIPGLRAGSCVYIRCDAESITGERMWSPEAWYTLIEKPRAEPVRASAASITRDIERTGVGVGVLPPADATPLISRSSMPVWRKTGEFRGGNLGTKTQDDLLESLGYIAINNGDIETTTAFADARLHIEWLAPPGGSGQSAGNSGVYLQGLYELQVLGTEASGRDLLANEAGAIYNVKPADTNASTGPGTWQAYDVWFTAARFKDGEKVSDARVTVLWNGQMIHDDVALPAPTGSRNRPGVEAERVATLPNGETVRVGALLLQDHWSTAEGPVRYRNAWIRTIEPSKYSRGDWIDIDSQLDAFQSISIVGGDAAFRVERRNETVEIVGTTKPNTPNTFLVLEPALSDFELLAEVRQDPRLNSGIQFRSKVDGGLSNRTGRLRGPQFELDPSPRSYSGGFYGEGLQMGWIFPPADHPYTRRAYKPGEWNSVRIVAEGPRVRTWVNGVPAADIHDEAHHSGHIALQVHGVGGMTEPMEVRWRDLRIRELRQME